MSLTPILLTGFEYGVATPVTNGFGICNALNGSPTISGLAARSGNYGLRTFVTGSAGLCRIRWDLSSTVLVGRVYFCVHTWPTSNVQFLIMTNDTGGNITSFRINASHNIMAYIDGTNFQTGTVLQLDTYYQLGLRLDLSAAVWTLDWQIENIPQPRVTGSVSASAVNAFYLGFSTNAVGDMFFDDIILSVTSDDYPIAAGSIEGKSPDRDGTHVSDANGMEKEDGTDIVPGYTTAHDLVNSVPIGDTTNYIKQSTAGVFYAELYYASTVQTNIQGAQAMLAYRAATTSPDTGACYLYDEDGTLTTLWGNPTTRADYSESSIFYKRVIMPNPSGGWDQNAVNAIYVRMGNSNDVNPVPWWVDTIMEVAYGIPPTTINLGSAQLTASGQTVSVSTGIPDININLQVAQLTASGQNLSVQPGAVSLPLGIAQLTASGQIITPSTTSAPISIILGVAQIVAGGQSIVPSTTPPPTTINLNVAQITANGQSIGVQPGAVSISLTSAQLSASGQALTVQPGAVSIALGCGQVIASGQSLTVQPGSVSISLSSAQLIAGGQSVTPQPGAVSISLGYGQITSEGQSLEVQPGAVSISLSSAQITAQGQNVTVSIIEGLLVNLSAAQITANAQALTIQAGEVIISLSFAQLVAEGQSVTVGTISNIQIDLNSAQIIASAQQLGVQPGEVSISLNSALLSASAQNITISSSTDLIVNLGTAIILAIGMKLSASAPPFVPVTFGREHKPIHYICPLSSSLLCGNFPMCAFVNCDYRGK